MEHAKVSVRHGAGRGERAGRRGDVLAMLRASPTPLSIATLAERLGVHPNTVRFHLDTLIERELVERVPSALRGPGRPPLMFRARGGMDPGGPRNYRLLAGVLVDGLASAADPVAKATQAGRDWGRRLTAPPARATGTPDDAAVAHLMDVLDEAGFAPELQSSTEGRRIGLRHCPFLDLVPARAEVVCPVHLGLMQGTMTALGSSVTVEGLDPFVEPDLCVAHLGEGTEEARP